MYVVDPDWLCPRSRGVLINCEGFTQVHRFKRHQHGRWLAKIGKVTRNKDLYLGHSTNVQKFDDIL
ncbi:unnamed protein product [Malus baccata var. baccata]